jgi:hypothetical protein
MLKTPIFNSNFIIQAIGLLSPKKLFIDFWSFNHKLQNTKNPKILILFWIIKPYSLNF